MYKTCFWGFLIVVVFYACRNKTTTVEPTHIQEIPGDSVQSDFIPDSSYCYLGIQVSCRAITETEYNLQKKGLPQRDSLERITDFDSVKVLLDGIVFWTDSTAEIPSYAEKIKARNGKVISITEGSEFFDYLWFIAYFPSEDVILFEGGHSSEVAFNLSNGEGTGITGNPEVSFVSPDGSYKVMSYYTGQASTYSFQKRAKDGYENVFYIQDRLLRGYNMEYIIEGFWYDNSTFYFITPEMGSDEIRTYYKLTVSPYQRSSILQRSFLIGEQRAGDFTIGMSISSIPKVYETTNTISIREENTAVICCYTMQLGIELSTLQTFMDIPDEDKIVSEINIDDDRFGTDKQIGTNSTLEEFCNIYPNAGFFSSYISQSFLVETTELKNIQFILDERGFTGNKNSLMKGALVEISMQDFKPRTPVTRVRIY